MEFCDYSFFAQDNGTLMNELRQEIEQFCASSIPNFQGYIWSKDPFSINVLKMKEDEGYYLNGRSYLSDSLEDEMYILFIVREITRRFPLVAQIQDNDGEFLLIEAADYLPSWMEPTTTENRIFLYGGSVHVVPQHIPVKSIIRDVVPVILDSRVETMASLDIQSCLERLVTGFEGRGERVLDNIHYANCLVPKNLAFVLSQDPCLISNAVDAFFLRDSISLKLASQYQVFKPDQESMVMTMVKFTRPLFAKTQCQTVYPPKGYPLPSVVAGMSSLDTSSRNDSYMLGMKLVMGFEILVKDSLFSSSPENEDNIESLPEWKIYLQRLQRLGYFGEEMEGSQGYKSLWNQAKHSFLEERKSLSRSVQVSPQKRIMTILKDGIPESFSPETGIKESSSDWLNVKAEDLDAIFRERSYKSVIDDSNTTKEDEKGKDKDHPENQSFDQIMAKFEAMLGQKSGYEGVYFSDGDGEDEHSDDHVDEDEHSEDDEDDEDENIYHRNEVNADVNDDFDECEDWNDNDSDFLNDSDFDDSEFEDEILDLCEDDRKDLELIKGMLKTIKGWTPKDKGEKPMLADLVAEINNSDIQGKFEESLMMMTTSTSKTEKVSSSKKARNGIPSALETRQYQCPDSDDESSQANMEGESCSSSDEGDFIVYDDKEENENFENELRAHLSFDPSLSSRKEAEHSLQQSIASEVYGGPTSNMLGSKGLYYPTQPR